jgi:predicted alpha/beta-hydrolase family hydrolase
MQLQIDTPTGAATADLDRPARAAALAVLTHGAYGGVGSADLFAVRDSLVADGVAVALVTQPYRVAGRRTPPAAAVQDAAWLAVLAALRGRRGFGSVPLVVGGRSNGARVACRTADAAGAAGVVALAFPVHPQGKPERSRLDELAMPSVPVLVVQGERDPFGLPPDDPSRRLVLIPGADHALRANLAAVAAAVSSFVADLLFERGT